MQSNYNFSIKIDYRDYPKDKVYVVRYDDFPNVIGAGETIEEAIEEAQGNLEVYLDYCKENNLDPKENALVKHLEDIIFNEVPLAKKLVEGSRKEHKLKEALLKLVKFELALYTTTDNEVVIASYQVYVEDFKNKYPLSTPIVSEEEYNLVKEALEEYGIQS